MANEYSLSLSLHFFVVEVVLILIEQFINHCRKNELYFVALSRRCYRCIIGSYRSQTS